MAGWMLVAMLIVSGEARAADPPMAFYAIGTTTEEVAAVSVVATQGGRVIIGEGWNVDVFDAAANRWLPPIPLHGDHWTAGAALLSDGRVLIAGTASSSTSAVSAEVVDPIAGASTPTGNMVIPRYGAYTATLNDGRVFIWSGTRAGTSGPPVDTAEYYDPDTNTFTSAGAALPARWNATFTRLADGRYLVAGGSDASGYARLDAEIYNPTTNTVTPTGSLPDFLIQHAAVLLHDGRVLIVGGSYNIGGSWRPSNRAYIYSPTSGQFNLAAHTTHERKLATATLLPDRNVLVAGGMSGLYENTVGPAEIFNPATNSFALGPTMVARRQGASAAPLQDGRVLIAGGATGLFEGMFPIQTVEVFGSDRIFEGTFD